MICPTLSIPFCYKISRISLRLYGKKVPLNISMYYVFNYIFCYLRNILIWPVSVEYCKTSVASSVAVMTASSINFCISVERGQRGKADPWKLDRCSGGPLSSCSQRPAPLISRASSFVISGRDIPPHVSPSATSPCINESPLPHPLYITDIIATV